MYTLKGESMKRLFTMKKRWWKDTVSAELIVDYKALKGDPSDNIIGVKGIGEKSATELIKNTAGLKIFLPN